MRTNNVDVHPDGGRRGALRRFFQIETFEIVLVGHLYPRQALRIDGVALANDTVEMEQIGRDRIDLVVAQRLGRNQRHGSAHVIEDRCRIGPVAANRLDRRLRSGERPLAADQLVVRLAGTIETMTAGAMWNVDALALLRRSAAEGQSATVRQDADI